MIGKGDLPFFRLLNKQLETCLAFAPAIQEQIGKILILDEKRLCEVARVVLASRFSRKNNSLSVSADIVASDRRSVKGPLRQTTRLSIDGVYLRCRIAFGSQERYGAIIPKSLDFRHRRRICGRFDFQRDDGPWGAKYLVGLQKVHCVLVRPMCQVAFAQDDHELLLVWREIGDRYVTGLGTLKIAMFGKSCHSDGVIDRNRSLVVALCTASGRCKAHDTCCGYQDLHQMSSTLVLLEALKRAVSARIEGIAAHPAGIAARQYRETDSAFAWPARRLHL